MKGFKVKHSNNFKLKYSCAGFTLIELLVVVSIIALLVSILLPALSKARLQARLVQCSTQLHEIGIGTLMYAVEHADNFPSGNLYNYPWLGGNNGSDKILEAKNPAHVPEFVGNCIVKQIDKRRSIFFCPLFGYVNTARWVETNDMFPQSGGYDFSSYFYLGNYMSAPNQIVNWDTLDGTSSSAPIAYATKLGKQSRVKIFQDLITTAWTGDHSHSLPTGGGFLNHLNPNALYSDGSTASEKFSSQAKRLRCGGVYNWW